ncbi:MAG: TPR end-of-group domain-containing protein [Myxococcales bacterium]
MRGLLVALLAAACSHAAAGPEKPGTARRAEPFTDGFEVEDAIHGVRYHLPPGQDLWQVTREGEARSASGVEAEVSSFSMATATSAAQCRDQARARIREGRPGAGAAAEAPRDESSADAPTPSWSFTSGAPSAQVRSRWAFYARGADCIVLRVSGPAGDPFLDTTFSAASSSFQALPLPPDRQREVDLLAGMGFLERRDPASALERFEALARREPDLAKAHFGALMAGFELGPDAYARALPHGTVALKAEHDLTPEQRQLALRAVGVMQLAENKVKEAADTLAELVVRAPDLAEAQYNYACALARLGDAQGAIDHLKAAMRLDGDLVSHARDDEDLKTLRGSPAFERLLGNPTK